MKRFKRDWPIIIVRTLVVIYLITLAFLITYGFTKSTQLLYIALVCGIVVIILSSILAILLGKEMHEYNKNILEDMHNNTKEDKDDRS